ncbi:MAG TPA: hypothetical protein VFU81_23365, partial [Thermomicrobiales bacterium]|nr:hypothetical protein [Thermomicrobiales bacterium]
RREGRDDRGKGGLGGEERQQMVERHIITVIVAYEFAWQPETGRDPNGRPSTLAKMVARGPLPIVDRSRMIGGDSTEPRPNRSR